jgi:hypothetical protein
MCYRGPDGHCLGLFCIYIYFVKITNKVIDSRGWVFTNSGFIFMWSRIRPSVRIFWPLSRFPQFPQANARIIYYRVLFFPSHFFIDKYPPIRRFFCNIKSFRPDYPGTANSSVDLCVIYVSHCHSLLRREIIGNHQKHVILQGVLSLRRGTNNSAKVRLKLNYVLRHSLPQDGVLFSEWPSYGVPRWSVYRGCLYKYDF